MTQIFGSHKCPNCHQKFDWTGDPNNQGEEEIRRHRAENKGLQLARFFKGEGSSLQANTRCLHCNYPVEIPYTDYKKDE
ncbi:hypothetical protein JQN58_00175 [Aneurinibacillus sp. BA2021]|nr:hypothetical protein [Aneurinibacillus sp. BA2021]